MSETMTINQASEYIRSEFDESHHSSNFYRWLREGKISGYRVGGQWRIYKDSINAFFCPKSENISNVLDGKPA
jgi:excisionase family DNA binding protein